MKEVKPSRKPLAIYYAIVLLVLLVINLVVMPWLAERQVQEVDYGTFMSMTEQENIGKVDIQSNQIIFTDKDNTPSAQPYAPKTSHIALPFMVLFWRAWEAPS